MPTQKQQQTLNFIEGFITENGHAPTMAQIASGIGIQSRGVAHRHVKALIAAGHLAQDPGRWRNLKVKHRHTRRVPILGKIAAGAPLETFEDNRQLNVDQLFGQTGRFVLQVQGDSMIGDNICDGDYIICEPCHTVRNDAIVIALIDNSAVTLKRCQSNPDGTVTLLPSNPKLSPMVYAKERVQIQGVYLGLLRLEGGLHVR